MRLMLPLTETLATDQQGFAKEKNKRSFAFPMRLNVFFFSGSELKEKSFVTRGNSNELFRLIGAATTRFVAKCRISRD